jgi:hypothetical protein
MNFFNCFLNENSERVYTTSYKGLTIFFILFFDKIDSSLFSESESISPSCSSWFFLERFVRVIGFFLRGGFVWIDSFGFYAFYGLLFLFGLGL